MRWKKLGLSKNVERRRGRSSGGGGRPIAMGGGMGMIIMALIAIFVFKQDPMKFLSQLGGSQDQSQPQDENRPATEEEKNTEAFISAIKFSSEQEWTEIFRSPGQQCKVSKMINYDLMTRIRTGGTADARMGPFYLPTEESIYHDTAFFGQIEREFNVGHHVQNLLGLTNKVHGQKGRVSDREYNRLSLKLELQADFLAGVWAHHANNLMLKTDGQTLLQDSDINQGDTFKIPYEYL